ncbi:hypothetical protein FisN_29Hu119 [Fistulifera solaris]|uniref:CRAL-TRIO domain-containing protein n=1 Tax=Fistulifera solaris TaxID=1519565 RepID=A0A1Z5K632_FISSO|nr:hypothetical protein FisN_29Hu119 [Fistulifera solaris]|eukprot:GAX21679.1 hypothetical protein FisN_29Hu119 [Fistulifera solaris]
MSFAQDEQRMMMQRARAHLNEVVMQMPVAAKTAYLEALTQCPHLVETETNPEIFLRFENFNYWSAAGRLVTYWRKRKEYFGDRAFLPMDLSGKGAMSKEDMQPIVTGCVTMLPNSNIIVLDRTSASDTGGIATRRRRRFFFVHSLMGSGTCPRLIINGFVVSDVLRRMNAEMKDLLADAFPIPSIGEIHVIFVKAKNQTVWQHLLPLGLQQMAGLVANVKIHNFDTVEQIAEELGCYGVTRNHLPPQLGGCYNIEFSSFVLSHKLPLSAVHQLQAKNIFCRTSATPDKAATSLYSLIGKGNPRTSFPRETQRHDSEGKGSLELLLDYFMKKAPDLPDVAETDSLNPLTPFDPILPSNHISNLYAEGSRTILLFKDADASVLSEYQCLVRQQIEFFEANQDDVTSSIRGRNKAIVLGQVGIRCRHCTHLPRQQRTMAATYYPTKLEGIYQTSQNLARKHLIGSCPFVPWEFKKRLTDLCESKSATGTGKLYWAETAMTCGVYEDESILRLK